MESVWASLRPFTQLLKSPFVAAQVWNGLKMLTNLASFWAYAGLQYFVGSKKKEQ